MFSIIIEKFFPPLDLMPFSLLRTACEWVESCWYLEMILFLSSERERERDVGGKIHE